MDLNIASSMAIELMKQHGLIDQGMIKDWKFRFTRGKWQFGVCKYHKKIIGLSAPLTSLNDEIIVKDVILHEISHALTIGANHGEKWKKVAQSIGCNATRCYNESVLTPRSKYTIACPNCLKVSFRNRKQNIIACSDCCNKFNSGRFNTEFVFVWTQNY